MDRQNCLKYYLTLLEGNGEFVSEKEMALFNIIRTMKLTNHQKVVERVFYHLNWGNIPLNEIYFSSENANSSRFERCILQEKNFFSGHSTSIIWAAFSMDGKYILTGDMGRWGENCKAILWDIQSGLPVAKTPSTLNAIEIISFTKGNDFFQLSYPEATFEKNLDTQKVSFENNFFDFFNQKILFRMPHITETGESLGQKYYCRNFESENREYCIKLIRPEDGSKEKLELYNKNGQLIKTLDGHTDKISVVIFDKECQYALTGSLDRTAILWKLSTGLKIHHFRSYLCAVKKVILNRAGTACISISDHSAILWKKENDKFILANKWLEPDRIICNAELIETENAVVLYFLDNTCICIDSEFQYMTIPQNKSMTRDMSVSEVVSPNKMYYAQAQMNGSVHLISTNDGKIIHKFTGNGERFRKLVINQRANILLGLTRSSVVFVWNIDTKNIICQYRFEMVWDAAISASGRFLLVAAWEKLQYISIEGKLNMEMTVTDFGKKITSIVISDDEKYGFAITGNGYAILLDIPNWAILNKYCGNIGRITSASISHDSTKLITASGDEICVWDIVTGILVKRSYTNQHGKITSLSLIDDDALISASLDGTIAIYHSESDTYEYLYHIPDIYIKNCPFTELSANDKVKEILRQQGAIIS